MPCPDIIETLLRGGMENCLEDPDEELWELLTCHRSVAWFYFIFGLVSEPMDVSHDTMVFNIW